MNIASNVRDLIGHTPLIKINKISQQTNTTILGKCEFLNPTSSIKDRIAKAMIQTALSENKINDDTTIIEPTSGNTGIGLACVCASYGLKLILTMPESMSIERRSLLKALGAKLELTPSKDGMSGAISKEKELNNNMQNSFMPQQFENKEKKKIHIKTTAQEILKDTNGEIDIFVASVGTGGTITGVGQVLKKHNPNIKIIAVEPSNSAVISGQKVGSHKIQGIGAGFVPKVLDTNIIDEIIKVDDNIAFETSRALAKDEGLLVGISSGANIWASTQVAIRDENKDKTIVTILCDTGERYLSSGLY